MYIDDEKTGKFINRVLKMKESYDDITISD